MVTPKMFPFSDEVAAIFTLQTSALTVMSEATGHLERPEESYFHQNLDGAKVGKIPEISKGNGIIFV